MEGCLASSSHMKIYTNSHCMSSVHILPHKQSLRLHRTTCHVLRVSQLSSWNGVGVSPLFFTNPKANPRSRFRPTKLYSAGMLINPDVSTFEWVPVVDQALLLASVFLTYMAGATIPVKGSRLSSHNQVLNDGSTSGNSTVPGSTAAKHEEINLKAPWDIVEEKLMDTLSAIEQGDNSVGRLVNFEQRNAKRPLSLYAIAEGPRIRLLQASFRWLKQQMNNISGAAGFVDMNDWSTVICLTSSRSPVSLSSWLGWKRSFA